MEGGCHCGAIRFNVTGEPMWIGVCYCTDCRKISGTPSMTFAEFEKDSLTILRGSPKEYQSSKKVTRTFCEACGSPLSYISSAYPDKVEIPVGAFDDPESLAPQVHIWTSRKPSWLVICDHLPQRE
jgi:hypothetical protein